MSNVFERVENSRQTGGAEPVIEIFGKAFEIDVCRIHVTEKLDARLRRDVSGRHRHGLDADRMTGLSHIDRVFEKDHGIVVGERDRTTSSLLRCACKRLWRCAVGERVNFARLRDIPVLAEFAGEIAARSAEGKHRRARQEVIERLFFDRVDAKTGRAAISLEHDLIVLAGAHETQPALPFAQPTMARTYIALHTPIGEGRASSAWELCRSETCCSILVAFRWEDYILWQPT